MIGTISCDDFLLALKRYREEVGAPKLCRDVVGSEQMSRRDSGAQNLTDNALASGRTRMLPTTPSRKADKLKEKQLQREAAEEQGSLW